MKLLLNINRNLQKLETALLLLLLLSLPYNLNSQWIRVFNNSNNTTSSLAATGNNNILAGIDGLGLYISSNSGANWTSTTFPDQYVYSLAVEGNNIYAATGGNGVYKSTDNGTNWTQTSLNFRTVRSLAVSGNTVYAGTNQHGVYKSSNGGLNWIQTPLNDQTVYALTINGNNVYAGNAVYGGLCISTDSGVNWSVTSLFIHDVFSVAVSGSKIFAGTNEGVFVSSNNGTNWAQTTLNNDFVNALLVRGNIIYAGTGVFSSFYISTDNGVNWIQKSDGFPSTISVDAICVDSNYVYAGIWQNGSGVYRRPISELIGILPISTEVPSNFSLSQNYPNPFNPGTKIRFEIPPSKIGAGEMTRLAVYDVFGKELETLVNENLKAGTYEVYFDAGKYSSGVYFYKLMTNEFSSTRKMILIK